MNKREEVERRADECLHDEFRWRAWEHEMRGRQFRAWVKNELGMAWFAVRLFFGPWAR